MKKTLPTYAFLSLITFSAMAQPVLTINHRAGSAPIGQFDLKVMSMSGETCFERNNVSEFTQTIVLDESQLTCAPQNRYAVYGTLKGWVYDATFYGDKYPREGGECTISHEKDGSFGSTKLVIKCSE